MPTKDSPYLFADARGGQNSASPPFDLAPNQVVAVQNMEPYRATVGRKRRGSRLVERDSGSVLPTNEKFCTLVGAYINDAFWFVLAQGATSFDAFSWGTGSPFDDWEAGPNMTAEACIVMFNGKWFYAYNSAVDRLHYTPAGAMALFEYVGLAPPAAPTITESAGAVTDNRKYRAVTFDTIFGARSEPSAETGVRTLSAEQASAAAPGAATANQDFYNAWELQAASDDDNYATWWVVGVAGSTLAIVDNNASLLSLEPAPELGLFEPPHSAKYLGVDDNRLLMAGAYESTDISLRHRVWFTPVLGDRDQGDDQRIPDTTTRSNWVDLDAGDDGGDITGFGPATLGEVLVFKRSQVWRLQRTGNLDAPYLPRVIDKSYGTFGYRTVCAGQDATGGPCVYFASSRGPVRVGMGGPEYLGAAIEDIWATVNQHGNVHTSQHAVFHQDRGQYWLWVSANGATVPSVLLIFSVLGGGWAVYTGPLATALCSAMLPRFLSEANKGITTSTVNTAPLVPYCCPNTNGQIVECDGINPQTGAALDTDLATYSGSGSVWTAGTAYQAFVRTGPIPPKSLDTKMTVQGAFVLAEAGAATLTLGLIPDYDTSKVRNFTVSLAAVASETRVIKRVEGAETANARALQLQIGDGSAVASQFVIDAVQPLVQAEAGR